MIHLVTGPVNSGKTSFLKNLVCSENTSHQWDGFLTLKLFQNSIHTGYELIHIGSEEKKPLCFKFEYCPDPWDEIHRTGMFTFSENAFLFGNRIVSESISNAKECNFVLDEAGPLEIEGKGFYSAINMLIHNHVSCWISVRDFLLKDFINCFSISDYKIISMEDNHDKS